MNTPYWKLWTLLFIDNMLDTCVQASPCNKFEERRNVPNVEVNCSQNMTIHKNQIYVYQWRQNDVVPVLDFTIKGHSKSTFALRQRDCEIQLYDEAQTETITGVTLERPIGGGTLFLRLEKPDNEAACSSSEDDHQSTIHYAVRMCLSRTKNTEVTVSCGGSVRPTNPYVGYTVSTPSPHKGKKLARQIGLGVGLTVGFLIVLGAGILIGLYWKRRATRNKKRYPAEKDACTPAAASNPNVHRELPSLPTDSATDYTYLDITDLQSDTGCGDDKNPDNISAIRDPGETNGVTEMVDNQNYSVSDSTEPDPSVASRGARAANNPRPGSDLVVVENVSYDATREHVGLGPDDGAERPASELALKDRPSSSNQRPPEYGQGTNSIYTPTNLEIIDNANYQSQSEFEPSRTIDLADNGLQMDNEIGSNYELAKPVA